MRRPSTYTPRALPLKPVTLDFMEPFPVSRSSDIAAVLDFFASGPRLAESQRGGSWPLSQADRKTMEQAVFSASNERFRIRDELVDAVSRLNELCPACAGFVLARIPARFRPGLPERPGSKISHAFSWAHEATGSGTETDAYLADVLLETCEELLAAYTAETVLLSAFAGHMQSLAAPSELLLVALIRTNDPQTLYDLAAHPLAASVPVCDLVAADYSALERLSDNDQSALSVLRLCAHASVAEALQAVRALGV